MSIPDMLGDLGLPPELQQQVLSHLDFPMSLAEAKEWRLELMEERSNYIEYQEEGLAEATYNLCEHWSFEKKEVSFRLCLRCNRNNVRRSFWIPMR